MIVFTLKAPVRFAGGFLRKCENISCFYVKKKIIYICFHVKTFLKIDFRYFFNVLF